MAFDGELAARREEDGIPVGVLTRQHEPAVKARGVAAEMPLANHAGVIAALLEMLRDVVTGAVEAVEHGQAVQVRILSGEQRGAAGRAYRIDAERASEARAFFRVPVDMRRLIDLRPVGRDGVLRVVVGKVEDDVRLVRREGLAARERKEGESKFHGCSMTKAGRESTALARAP